MVRGLPLLILMAAAPQDRDFAAERKALERECAAALNDKAAELDRDGHLEAAQVFSATAEWLNLSASAPRLEERVRAMTAAGPRDQEALRRAASPFTNSEREGLVYRYPTATKAIRAENTIVRFPIPSGLLSIRGRDVKREPDPKRPSDIEPRQILLATGDEVIRVDGATARFLARADDVLHGEGSPFSRRFHALAVDAVKAGNKTEVRRLLIAAQWLDELRALVRALWRFNDARLAAKLSAVSFSPDLSVGCFLHARYLALETPDKRQGLDSHREVETSAYHTREGAAAGLNGVLGTQVADFLVDDLMATFFHRVPMLHPGLQQIGIGQWMSDWQVWGVIDVKSGLDAAKTGEVIWPPPGAAEVFTRFPGGEVPNPLPDGVEEAGLPLTVTFYGTAAPTAVRATLTAGTESIAHWVSTPQKPASAIVPNNADTVCVIPKALLKPGTAYELTVSGAQAGRERAWTARFTTRTKPFRW